MDYIFGDPLLSVSSPITEPAPALNIESGAFVMDPRVGWEPLLNHYNILRADDYRAAGIIYGQWSRVLKEKGVLLLIIVSDVAALR